MSGIVLNNTPKKIITEKDQIYLTAIWSFLLSYIQWKLLIMEWFLWVGALFLNVKEKRWQEMYNENEEILINTKDGGTFL